MSPPTLGIIRVLTTSDDRVLQEHGRILESRYGLKTLTRCIGEQPNGIFDAPSEALAVPKIVELGREMVGAGCGALFLSCAADPGLAELRAAVNVPVISAGSAAARIAANLALPVAVLGIGTKAPAPYRALLGEDVPYARPEGVKQTTDLLKPEGLDSALVCAKGLLADGARVIAFACTGFSTIGLASYLRERLGCVAIDAVDAAGMFAVEMLGGGTTRASA
jgi:allantoin racemase